MNLTNAPAHCLKKINRSKPRDGEFKHSLVVLLKVVETAENLKTSK